MIYFSYGSNMSVRRLRSRVPSARPVGAARLPAHQLRFHKVSHHDGSAKCDACHTGNDSHFVMGVLYDILPAEKSHLDRVEGVGYGYEQKQVVVEALDGGSVEAFTYYATLIDPSLRPFGWYHLHVLTGAREHRLPERYVCEIMAVDILEDPDAARHAREISIYSTQS